MLLLPLHYHYISALQLGNLLLSASEVGCPNVKRVQVYRRVISIGNHLSACSSQLS